MVNGEAARRTGSHRQDQDVTTATDNADIDRALQRLCDARSRWAACTFREKVALLDELRRRVASVGREWVEVVSAIKGVHPQSPEAGEEWFGLAFLLRGIRMLREAFEDLSTDRPPRLPGPARALACCGLAVSVFPDCTADRILFPGTSIEIWTEPGVTPDILATEPWLRCTTSRPGKTTLVLGAGNVAMHGPLDVLERLFRDCTAVVYKPHPLLDGLTPLLTSIFQPLIDDNCLAIVSGGAREGEYLVQHDLVDEWHLTGSATTYEAIMFGKEGGTAQGAPARVRRTTKPFTCELGGVNPVIVVPGPWSASDLAFQGEHLAGMHVINAGYTCLAPRVIVQHASWSERPRLLDEIRWSLARTPTRKAFYPGARDLHWSFVEAHPHAEFFGEPVEGSLPWTLIAGLDPAREDDPCFRREAFGPLFAETGIEARDVPEYLARAVRFANDVLRGSLTATILVHPSSLRDPEVAHAVERAVV